MSLAFMLGALGLYLLLAIGIAKCLQRRSSDEDEGTYVQQIREWYADPPFIAPARLPEVKPLKAQVEDWRVTRFRGRLSKPA